MIILRTGVPGAGKTLNMIQELKRLIDRWAKHPEEARPVFAHNIPDLALPHSPLPVKSVIIGRNVAPQLVPDLAAIPDGSLVLMDEAQGFYPPRSSAMAAPDHVAELNTHRHRGLDLWVTTQHPKLLDHSLRALVGKHIHFRRLFGGKRAMMYEWDSCSDSLSGMKNAVTSYWSYPRNVFAFYKSAEIHTKQHFKLPWFVWLPLISLLMSFYFYPKAYDTLFNRNKPVEEKKGGQQSKPIDKPVSAPVPAQTTQVASAAVVEDATPEYAGCMASESKCTCITKTGKTLLNPPMCRESANGFGYLINVSMNQSTSTPSTPSTATASITPAKIEGPSVSTLTKEGFGVLGKAADGVRVAGQ